MFAANTHAQNLYTTLTHSGQRFFSIPPENIRKPLENLRISCVIEKERWPKNGLTSYTRFHILHILHIQYEFLSLKLLHSCFRITFFHSLLDIKFSERCCSVCGFGVLILRRIFTSDGINFLFMVVNASSLVVFYRLFFFN